VDFFILRKGIDRVATRDREALRCSRGKGLRHGRSERYPTEGKIGYFSNVSLS
jgi:hypothetical protein